MHFSACVVPSVSNATPDSTSSITFNTTVTYTCRIGYSHTAGDLTRTCDIDGQLIGSTPVCTSKLHCAVYEHIVKVSRVCYIKHGVHSFYINIMILHPKNSFKD